MFRIRNNWLMGILRGVLILTNNHYIQSCHSWFTPSFHTKKVVVMKASFQAWEANSRIMTEFILPNLPLTSPRAWLESLPHGAYTVLRCDHIGGTESTSTHKWGPDFHIQRLESSFRTLVNTRNDDIIGTREAIQQTDEIIDALLSCCEIRASSSDANVDDSLCDSYMVTVLWFLQNEAQICVRGHITPYQITWNPKKYNPQSWKAVLAYDPKSELPSRKKYFPEAKLSSWCYTRRPLETKFKGPYQADEVFLLDVSSGAINDRGSTIATLPENVGILEGLTSNVFAVHQDGTLYTAPNHAVLGGYARKLVIESATRLGMKVNSSQPIRLAEAAFWTEVFVTSAIKLVTPVHSILAPEDDSEAVSSTLIWSQPVSENNQRVWEAIYMNILSHNLK